MITDNRDQKAMMYNIDLVAVYTPVLINMLVETFWQTNIFEAGSDMEILLSEARNITSLPLRRIPEGRLKKMRTDIGNCCVGDFADHKKTPTEGRYLPISIRQVYYEQTRNS